MIEILTRKNLILLLLLIFAIIISFLPHLDYPYPIHHDEWMHMAYSDSLIQSGEFELVNPFQDSGASTIGANLEIGFHILWNVVHRITGLDLIDIFAYFPPVIFLFTILSIYLFTRREGFGLEAALFGCLIPTSVGILGPAFMVPLSMGLFFVPLILLLAFYFDRWAGYFLILIFTFFLIMTHLPAVLVTYVILAPYLVLNSKAKCKNSIGILSALIIPSIFLLLLFHEQIMQVLASSSNALPLSSWVRLPSLLQTYGVIPIIFAFIGSIYLFLKGGNKNFALLSGFICLLIILLIYIKFSTGFSIFYVRGLIYMLVLISIFAGAGLSMLFRYKLELKQFMKGFLFSLRLGKIVGILIVTVIVIVGLCNSLFTNYYHMVDKMDVEGFEWMRANIGSNNKPVLLDPWQATAFTAITQEFSLRRIFGQRQAADDKINRYLENSCSDSNVLNDNLISFVYNRLDCNNTDLIKIKDSIYKVNPGQSNSLIWSNQLQNASFERLNSSLPSPWFAWTSYDHPDFLYPEVGLHDSQCVGVRLSEETTYETWHGAFWAQVVQVTPGKSYYMGGWIKTENVVGNGGAMIQAHWNGSGNIWISSTEFMNYINGTNGWIYYEGIVVAPPGADTCTICCLMADCRGTALFDSLIFREKD
jgi:hypothetical protein